MNMPLTIISIILIITLIVIISIAIFVAFQVSKELERKRKLNELLTYSSIYNSMESFEEKLNEFVSGKIDEYRAFNSQVFDDYINDKTQKTIIKTITVDILTTISPALLAQLSIVYNRNMLDEIINKKVTLGVIALVVENNASLE